MVQKFLRVLAVTLVCLLAVDAPAQYAPPNSLAYVWNPISSQWQAVVGSGTPVTGIYPPAPVGLFCVDGSGNWVKATTSGNCFGSGSSGPQVTPEASGAKGDGVIVGDAAIGPEQASATNSGNSATPSAPTITTTQANTLVISVFGALLDTWSSGPSAGTQRVNFPAASSVYGTFISDQNKATAGSVPAVTGTIASSELWATLTVALGNDGSTSTFVNSSTVNSASPATVTVPSGTQNGDFMMTCASWFRSAPTPPAGFLQISATSPGDPDGGFTNCWQHTAASEPSSYSWVTSGAPTDQATFVTVVYRGPGRAMNVVRSATANFASADVGKPICAGGQVGNTSASAKPQVCGTITSLISSSQIQMSVSQTAVVSSGVAMYATDDTAAFHTMMSTAPCSTVGCQVQLSTKKYGLTGTLTIPPQVPFQMIGTGAGVSQTDIQFQFPFAIKSTGTQLLFLTQSLSTPAISAHDVTTETSDNAMTLLQDFALVGGAGLGRDGGGSDGLDIINWQNFFVNRVVIANFAGAGAQVYPIGADGWITSVTFDKVYVFSNNGAGIEIGNGAGTSAIETVNILNGMIEGNGLYGIDIEGGGVQGCRIEGNVIQWDNINGAGYEVNVTGNAQGCELSANYIEAQGGGQSHFPDFLSPTQGALGIHVGSNFGAEGIVPRPARYTSAALLGFSSIPGHPLACATDAAACTNGTTLTGSGSTMCKVQYNGTNWIETGSSGDCN